MKKVLLSLATVALLVACGGETKNEVPKANSGDSASSGNSENTSIDSDNSAVFQVVDSASVLNWRGSAVGKEHYGTVDYSGMLKVDGNKLVGGELVFDMKTIISNDLEGEYKQKLEGHLKAPDFFNVDSFPTAKLLIKGYSNGTLNGDLTIKSTTKAISFPAEVKVSENVIEGSAKFSIDRTEFGIVYGSGSFFDLAKDKIISDKIEFDVKVVANK